MFADLGYGVQREDAAKAKSSHDNLLLVFNYFTSSLSFAIASIADLSFCSVVHLTAYYFLSAVNLDELSCPHKAHRVSMSSAD